MSDLKSGMLVQHASLGLGRVVALEDDAVHVFFQASANRFATKLRLPTATPFLSPTAANNPWLEGMSFFSRDSKTGRYGLSEAWLPQDQAIARFTEAFPQGLGEQKGVGKGKEKGDRAGKWRAAHEAFFELLGGGEGERLLADNKIDELVGRALRVERHVIPLQPTADKTSLKDALQDPTASAGFFAALFELLAVPAPGEPSFEKLASAVTALPRHGSPGAAWQIATALPFIAQPDRHMILRPRPTCEAAHRLGFDVSCDAAPNWFTYSALLRLSGLLLDTLRRLGARDYIDVESFMHLTATKRASA